MKLKQIKTFTLVIACLISPIAGFAQDKSETLVMTLEECLEYAKANSITLQKSAIQIEDKISDELTSKGVFLPTVSGSISQGLNYTPFTTIASANKASYTGSYGIDLSMPIYTGGKNKANLEKSAITTQISELSYEEQENALEVSITEIFVQILYTLEQIEVNEKSLELSQTTLERGKAYLEVGSINPSEYAQLETSKADSEYTLIVSQTTLSNLYVSLKHLLEISQDINIVAVPPHLEEDLANASLASVSDVYESALEIRPEVKSSSLSISSAELDQTVAKAGYLPTVSLTAGIGVSHQCASDYTFSAQLGNNFNTSLGARVSIPIFSNYQNQTAVSKARNAITTANLTLTDTQKELYQTIETLRNTASNAQSKYVVSQYKLEATKVSLELVTERYNVGMMNIIDLLTEQDNLRESAQDYLINKYQFILNKALLEYYRTDSIKL